jgi:hypothetical protein
MLHALVTTPRHMYMALFFTWLVYTAAPNKSVMFYGCPCHYTWPHRIWPSLFYMTCIYSSMKVTELCNRKFEKDTDRWTETGKRS